MSAIKSSGKYSTAESRWAGVGPYYAMFPTSFADEVVTGVHAIRAMPSLDPFAGRGTAIYSARPSEHRHATGIEINPVGYVYANAKLKPGDQMAVTSGACMSWMRSPLSFRETANDLPPFFHHCFAPKVREFLVAARAMLNWRQK